MIKSTSDTNNLQPEEQGKSRTRLWRDLAALALLMTGVLLWIGVMNLSEGAWILGVSRFLRTWFGIGRVLIALAPILTGISLIVLNHSGLRLKLPKRVWMLLHLIFVLFLSAASTFSRDAGGKTGELIYNGLDSLLSAGVSRWLLRILTVGCFIALFDVKAIIAWLKTTLNLIIDRWFPRNPDVFSEGARLYRKRKAVESMEGMTPAESEAELTGEYERNMEKEIKSDNKGKNRLPPLNLLEPEMGLINKNIDLHGRMAEIEQAMDEFGTPIHVTGYSIGPAIIQFQVAPGVLDNGSTQKLIRVNQVAQMERDLAVRLGVANLTIQAPVPGKSYIGIDVPNPDALKVRLRPLIESPEFKKKNSPLSIALGRDISGTPVIVDLQSMPHLLVAGTTNSGKSICLRSIAVCLIMNNTPENLRLIMIDPKRVELFRFNGLPHLLGKVETEYERSIVVLGWALEEMHTRYSLFNSVGVRSLGDYNRYALRNKQQPLPYIVIMIDEVSEIMKGVDKSGQDYIDSLASLARATGMHLIIATQRPDTSIITGKIKTNIPARIAMNVASGVDSRVIMGRQGAEKLLGRGDMYFVDPTLSIPVRVQGPYLTDQEIDNVVALWKKLAPATGKEQEAAPWEEMIEEGSRDGIDKDNKELREAIRLVCRTGKATANYLQAKMRVSFPKASRLLDQMEKLGVVGPIQLGGRSREVIWSEEEAESYGMDAGYKEDE